MYKPFAFVGLAAAAAVFATGVSAADAAQTFNYTVDHGTYGRIGTYSDTIEQNGDSWRIDTKLRVAVKILGIVVHREEADRTELWRDDRLISFHSVTTTNGKTIEVVGEAGPGGFTITSPAGTVVAPANVYTSSPWSARLPQSDVMMSTKTGKVETVRISGGESSVTSVYGIQLPVRHYEFLTDKRQEVWLDPHGIPVRFRTEVAGNPIDFALTQGALAAVRPF